MQEKLYRVLNFLSAFIILGFFILDEFKDKLAAPGLFQGILALLIVIIHISKYLIARSIPCLTDSSTRSPKCSLLFPPSNQVSQLRSVVSFFSDTVSIIGYRSLILLAVRCIDPYFSVLYQYEYGHLFTMIERAIVDFSICEFILFFIARFFPTICFCDRYYFMNRQKLFSILFYVLFSYAYFNRFMNTTMFRDLFTNEMLTAKLYRLCACILLLLAVTSASLCEENSLWIILCSILAVGFFHFKYGGQQHNILMMCILIVAAKGMNFKKILKISVIIGFLVTVIAYICARTGIILFLSTYSSDLADVPRLALGCISPTDLAAHLLYMLISICFLLTEEARFSSYILTLLLISFSFHIATALCHARTNAFLIAVLFILVFLRTISRSLSWNKGSIHCSLQKIIHSFSILPCLSYIICSFFSIFESMTYSEKKPVLFENIISAFLPLRSLKIRLEYANDLLVNNSLSLWGTHIKESGNGGRLSMNPDYSFIDISYIRILIIGGIAFSIVLILSLTVIQFRNYRHSALFCILLLAIIALNGLVEHHLQEFYYNLFPLMIFASCSDLYVGSPSEKYVTS